MMNSMALKYDELEVVENVARGRSLSATFSTAGHHNYFNFSRTTMPLRQWRNASEYRLPSKNAHR